VIQRSYNGLQIEPNRRFWVPPYIILKLGGGAKRKHRHRHTRAKVEIEVTNSLCIQIADELDYLSIRLDPEKVALRQICFYKSVCRTRSYTHMVLVRVGERSKGTYLLVECWHGREATT